MPGEREAAARAWPRVHDAFTEREPVPWPRRRSRPLLALAAVLALLAAVVSPPGRAVLREVREAIGVEHSAPALFSLPAPGRLLVESRAGAWVVQPDGSKRLLRRYREAAWSPFGRFVAGTRRNELVALEPDGNVRWTLARPRVAFPQWGGSRVDTRVAYLSGGELRVVAGDGRNDRSVAARARRAQPAWRPGSAHVLSFAAPTGRVVTVDVDRRVRLWSARPVRAIEHLEWSRDGRLLLVQASRALVVLGADGRQRFDLRGPKGAPVETARFAPSGSAVAFVQRARGGSQLWVIPRLRPDGSAARRVFSGAGRFTGLEWSPDGRWLLVAWKDADQWVFIRSAHVRRIRAVSGISAQFDGGRFPSLAGWCCA